MSSTKKPRSDSKVAGLAPEIRAEVARRLGEANESYKDVAAWLKAEHGVTVSDGALCNWYSVHSWSQNAATARQFAEQVKAESKAQGNYDAATLALVQERAYIMARTQGADVKDLATLAGIIGDSAKLRLKERELGLSERKVSLLEKKAAQAEAAEGVTRDDTLSPAQRDARLREIFGLRPAPTAA
jgi:hypothetical protein